MINWLKRLIYPEVFDLERVDGLFSSDKVAYLTWIERVLGYFSGNIQEIRKFYVIFTLESGQSYRIDGPILIEKSIDLNGGFLNVTFPMVTAKKECRVIKFRVYDRDDNFLVLREPGNGFNSVEMNSRDSLNFSYRITT